MANTMEISDFKGRGGLSRNLKIRFSNSGILMVLLATASIFGFLFFVDVLPQLVSGNFRSLLSLSTWAVLFGFPLACWGAHLIRETAGLQLHMHHDRLVIENHAKKYTVEVWMKDIESLRFGRSQGVDGFFIHTKDGKTMHLPLLLERAEYVLDALRFYRPDLTQDPAFMRVREKAILMDHFLSHTQDFFARRGIKAAWTLFASPLLLKHTRDRIRRDPLQVRRDIEFEMKVESYGAKAHIALTLGVLALLILWLAL